MSPDPQIVVKHVIAQFGGPEKAFDAFDSDFRMMSERWGQDTDIIGRILRSHLYVEHFLTEYLIARNPQLGSLDDARITFAQKVALVGNATDAVSYLIPGIRRLNTIRNRIAHTLAANVSADDADVFLSIAMFRAFRDEGAKRAEGTTSDTPSSEPIDVLEDFARHAGSMLHATASPTAEHWAEALRLAEIEEHATATDSTT